MSYLRGTSQEQLNSKVLIEKQTPHDHRTQELLPLLLEGKEQTKYWTVRPPSSKETQCQNKERGNKHHLPLESCSGRKTERDGWCQPSLNVGQLILPNQPTGSTCGREGTQGEHKVRYNSSPETCQSQNTSSGSQKSLQL